MGWFSKKQPQAVDDALVERTLAFAQEVAQEKPDDEQALLALIDGITMMPPKPAQTGAVVVSEPPVMTEIVIPTDTPPADREPAARSLPVAASSPLPSPGPVRLPFLLRTPKATETIAEDSADAPSPVSGRPLTNLLQTITTPAAQSVPPSVQRPVDVERVRSPEPRRSAAPPQSEMRREIAQRVQNFKAHQQRLNDEREARIKQIYADMQARLEKSGAQKSPPTS